LRDAALVHAIPVIALEQIGHRARQVENGMLGFSDLDVGITVGEFLVGCFFIAVVWRLIVGNRDRGADALRRDGGRLY
jgi:hypothetical protein